MGAGAVRMELAKLTITDQFWYQPTQDNPLCDQTNILRSGDSQLPENSLPFQAYNCSFANSGNTGK